MIILSRKVNESVIIGDPNSPIRKITIVKIEGGTVQMKCECNEEAQANSQVELERIREDIICRYLSSEV